MNILHTQCLTEEQDAKVHVLQSSQTSFRYRIFPTGLRRIGCREQKLGRGLQKVNVKIAFLNC